MGLGDASASKKVVWEWGQLGFPPEFRIVDWRHLVQKLTKVLECNSRFNKVSNSANSVNCTSHPLRKACHSGIQPQSIDCSRCRYLLDAIACPFIAPLGHISLFSRTGSSVPTLVVSDSLPFRIWRQIDTSDPWFNQTKRQKWPEKLRRYAPTNGSHRYKMRENEREKREKTREKEQDKREKERKR